MWALSGYGPSLPPLPHLPSYSKGPVLRRTATSTQPIISSSDRGAGTHCRLKVGNHFALGFMASIAESNLRSVPFFLNI